MDETVFVILRKTLAVGAAVWVAWGLYSEKIAPLATRENEAARSVAELRERIQGARNSIKEIHKLEQEATEARTELERKPSDIPAGQAIVWFPPRLKGHFDRFGIAVGVTRLISVREEARLPGYKRSYWSIGVPFLKGDRTANSLLLAVADLERQDRFVKVVDFALQPDLENPGNFTAAVSVSALVRE